MFAWKYSRVRLFRSHSNKKRTLNYQNTYRELKIMLMTDKECLTSVQGGGGLIPISLVALLQTLACNVGGHTYSHQNHLPR